MAEQRAQRTTTGAGGAPTARAV